MNGNRKNNIKISMLVILLFKLNLVFAAVISCPTLPLKTKLYRNIGDEWRVVIDINKQPGFVFQKYQEYFGEKHSLDEWLFLSSGLQRMQNKYFIQCCSENTINQVSICALMYTAKQCQPLLIDEKRYAFRCSK